jgi:DNA-binding MarR family transcriptional regulator
MPLSESAILVLYAIQNSADHSYAALCQQAGKSRGTIARALEELIAAGSITASARKFQQPITYSVTREAAGNNSTASLPQSKSLKVQKSKSLKVQSIALHDDEDVLKENNSSSCNPKTFELLDQRPDFRAQVFNLLGEWKLAGRKREQLADAIANLSGTPESILSDIQNIRAGAVQRATSNPAGLTVHILTEYTETRQIALFDLPTPAAPRKQGRGAHRRPQVQYTEEQREAAEERARAQIAERAARRAACDLLNLVQAEAVKQLKASAESANDQDQR